MLRKARPRPKQRKPQTRAEEFFAKMRGERTPVAPGVNAVKPSRKSKAMARLLAPSARCEVDIALTHAVAKGLLKGDLQRLRLELLSVAFEAYAAAMIAYAEQLALPIMTERQAKATRLAEALRDFMEEISSEAEFCDELGEAAEAETHDDDNIRAMLALGEALEPLLATYAARPQQKHESRRSLDHEAREFVAAFMRWWEANANDTHMRGAGAIRDRIAIALWSDCGESIPEGYESPRKWLSYHIDKLRKF